MEYVTRNGDRVPKIGLGTWQLAPRVARDAVGTALELGYRHIDTAQAYRNERAVGRAIREADVDRDSVFLTTKVNAVRRSFGAIVDSVAESVAKLGTDYVDLILIHWPNPLAALRTVMPALNEIVDRGLARHLGVSNFGKERLAKAQRLSDRPVFANQVLFHPWWPQRDLLRYCQAEDIVLTAYSPLANGGAIDDDRLASIGARYDKSGPQVALRWAIEHRNVVAIPKSTSRAHLAENIDIFDFELTAEEHDLLTRKSYLRTGLEMARGQLRG